MALVARYRKFQTQSRGFINEFIAIEDRMMNARTLQMMQRLESAQWFANIGRPPIGNHRTVQSWEQALGSCTADVWSSVQLQVKNRIARDVRQKNYDRSDEWNGIAAELRKAIATVVANSVEPVAKKFQLKSDFQGAVSWDMLMICLETEFSDVISPIFFVSRLLPIYEAGHFPCGWEGPKLNEGWDGELLDWRLIVY